MLSLFSVTIKNNNTYIYQNINLNIMKQIIIIISFLVLVTNSFGQLNEKNNDYFIIEKVFRWY